METPLNKPKQLRLSAKNKESIMDVAVYLFVILFMYTAANKLMTLNFFASTLSKSPLFGSFNFPIAWAIPIAEIIISLVLIIPSVRKTGMRAALALMLVFTSYLIYMVFSKNELPCHCGGVISSMTWMQHIWFNIAFIALAIGSLVLNRK